MSKSVVVSNSYIYFVINIQFEWLWNIKSGLKEMEQVELCFTVIQVTVRCLIRLIVHICWSCLKI